MSEEISNIILYLAGNWNYSAGIGNDPRENRKFNMVKQETEMIQNTPHGHC